MTNEAPLTTEQGLDAKEPSILAKRLAVYVAFVVAAVTPVWFNLFALAVAWLVLVRLAPKDVRLGVLLTLAALVVNFILHVAVW